ncbi:MAG: DNA polymerase III subunit gamma/tau [Candidatus Wildermuthbacteria bacterium]|nr:DNA polymerase III subunit gamma/tau [Candidatus Wildermuthbacteria bacterium]
MANLVLYRKYRPQSFSEVVGQAHIVRTLKNAVAGNLISHAYLFCGPRGCGKTTLARILAKAVNCKNIKKAPDDKAGEPCNACASCLEINQGRSLDFLEIDAASNRGIDEMRELREGARFAPTTLAYKVFVIDEAHQLTKDASNALLKTLEEPPSHAIFILATTETSKMISTIVSRCQRFDFLKLTHSQILACLADISKKEDTLIEEAALRVIASHSGGALRDAESLLDRVFTFHAGKKEEITAKAVQEILGIVDIEILSRFADLLSQKKASEAVEFLNANLERGMDPQEFAKNILSYLRQIIILKISPAMQETLAPGLTQEQRETLGKQAENTDMKLATRALKSFMDAEQQMRYADIVQLPLELAIIDTCIPNS